VVVLYLLVLLCVPVGNNTVAKELAAMFWLLLI
jgi:hypothetical protein